MTLSAIIVIVFAICILIMNHRSRYIRWILAVSLVLSATIVFLQIYFCNYTMITKNVINSEQNILFALDAYFWKQMPVTSVSARDINRIVNCLSASFIYLSLVLPIIYGKQKIDKKHKTIILLLLIAPLALTVIYDPQTNYYLYEWVTRGAQRGQAKLHMEIVRIIQFSISAAINIYYVSSIVIWIWKYRLSKLKIVKNQIVFVGSYMFTMSSLFMLLFVWLPVKDIKIYNFYVKLNFIPTNYTISYDFFSYLPLIMSVIVAINLYWIARLQIVSRVDRKQRVVLKNDLAKANSSFQGVFHAFKNDFMAIKFLSQKINRQDIAREELHRTANEIEMMCDYYVERINNLKIHLKNQSIVLKKEIVLDILDPIVSNFSCRYDKVRFDILNISKDECLVVDKHSFSEVIENIIENSVHAIESKDIDYGYIQIELEKEGEWTVLHITDNGTGIAKEDLKKVFEPFYSKKNYNSNWGIGLSYCRSVIDSHGGDLEIKSIYGEYTVVNIILPQR